MSDIKSREWYDQMSADVKEVLETLVCLDCAFVGYINKDIGGQPITLSWDREAVTVTADKYTWKMPIAWFIDAELADKIVAPNVAVATAARTVSEAARARPVAQDERNEDAAAPASVAPGDTLAVGGIKVPDGVKSVDEILAEQGLDGDGE